MPGPVIAARIGWPYSEGPLKKLLARIRPEYVGIDPVDRSDHSLRGATGRVADRRRRRDVRP
jgi:hypothetical protein